MLFLLIFFFLCASSYHSVEGSSSPECGRETMVPTDTKPDLAGSVIPNTGDSTSEQKKFPWLVVIFKNSQYICEGSLIDSNHVISTAHCVITSRGVEDPSVFTVKVGNVDVDGGVPFAVEEIKIHEDFSRKGFDNDISILTLQSKILDPSIVPICLPDDRIAAMDLTGKPVTLLGWDFANSLRVIIDDLTVTSPAQCGQEYQMISEKYSLPKGMAPDVICTANREFRKNECEPYSGAPLMYKNNYLNLPDDDPKIPWVLVGIAAFCQRNRDLEGHTRVSHFIDWIQKNT